MIPGTLATFDWMVCTHASHVIPSMLTTICSPVELYVNY